MDSASQPLPFWFRLLPWGLIAIVALPLLFFHWPSPDGDLGRCIIAIGQAVRQISVARLFEEGMPLLPSSAWTLAVLDWQSLAIAAMFGLGLLGIAASVLRTSDLKLVLTALGAMLLRLIIPAVAVLFLIGPNWAGYNVPAGDRMIDVAHLMLIGVGSLIGQFPIMTAVALWTFDRDQLRATTAEQPGRSGIIVARRTDVARKLLLGTGGLEICLRLFPVLLVLGAWAVLRFQNSLPDGLLLGFIDGGAIIRPLALPELIGWTPRALASLDPLQGAMVLAVRDWQGFALSLALGSALVLLILEWRRTLPQHRLSWLLKSAVGLGLFGVFFYWFIGGVLRSSVDPAGWQPEMATAVVLMAIFAVTARHPPKSDPDQEKEKAKAI